LLSYDIVPDIGAIIHLGRLLCRRINAFSTALVQIAQAEADHWQAAPNGDGHIV
jgi:hypothetical protein